MRILIIGGTGLISSAISRAFLARGIDLTVYNRGKTRVRIPSGAQMISGDRYDFATFEQQMADAGAFDCVIDMITYTPEQAESGVRAFTGKAGHYIFCSTVDVYSKPAHRYPILEDEPRMGNNSYGRNKIACEDIFSAAHERGDLPITIIRPAMSYGEGGGIVDFSGFSTRIFDRLLKGKPLLVHGDGTSLWGACHVEDVAQAFVQAAAREHTFGKAYHVTGEEWLTWNRYYQIAAQAIGAPEPNLMHIPTDLLMKVAPERAALIEQNFSGNNIFDNSAAHTDLDFRYTISWETGVGRTYEWLVQNNRIEDSADDPFVDQLAAAWETLSDSLRAEIQV